MLNVVIRPLLFSDITRAVAVVSTHSQLHAELADRDLRLFFAGKGLPGATFICAEIESALVGLMGMYDDPDSDVVGICWAVWLYVDQEYRGLGIGKKLISWIEIEARHRGARKLYLDVGNKDQHSEAIKMYERRGYLLEAQMLDYFREGEHKFIYALRL